MSRDQNRRKKGRHRGTAARANADLMSHLVSLGLETVASYRAWCREHGFSGALNKGWQERRQERMVAKQARADAQADVALIAHVEALGLGTVASYRAWCLERGLSDSVHKSPQQQRKELALATRLRGEAALVGMKRQVRRPKDMIHTIYRGEVDGADLKRPYLQKVHETFAGLEGDRDGRKALLRLLLHLYATQHADLLGVKPAVFRLGPQEGNTFIEGLGALARHHKDWTGKVEDWRPDSHNSRRQFGALARHLLAKYDVPAFMDAAWFQVDSQEARQQQRWFKHIGIGQNIRTADTPVRLTKKMAHLFLQAPEEYTIEEALRWGQVLGMGGHEPLVRAVNGTRLGASFENEDFWMTVIHFFVNHPMLDPDQVGPVVDYIYNQKYVPQEVVGAGGIVEQREPPQPNFAMKGRSMDKLVRQVEAWHRQLARDSRLPHREWKPSGIEGFDSAEEDTNGKPLRWSIQELLTTKALVVEGRRMHHCVGSYANNCQKGNTSIWSMQAEDAEGKQHRVMTIAMNNGSRSITQARGKYNALPTGKTRSGKQRRMEQWYRDLLKRSGHILHLWGGQEGLVMANYALRDRVH